MLRTILCGLCLFAIVGFVTGEEKKANVVMGKFKEYKDGKVTLTSGKKGEEKDVTVDVGADFAKVTLIDGDNKKEGLKAGDAFKDVKPGTPVKIEKGDGDKVVAVTVGVTKKK